MQVRITLLERQVVTSAITDIAVPAQHRNRHRQRGRLQHSVQGLSPVPARTVVHHQQPGVVQPTTLAGMIQRPAQMLQNRRQQRQIRRVGDDGRRE